VVIAAGVSLRRCRLLVPSVSLATRGQD